MTAIRKLCTVLACISLAQSRPPALGMFQELGIPSIAGFVPPSILAIEGADGEVLDFTAPSAAAAISRPVEVTSGQVVRIHVAYFNSSDPSALAGLEVAGVDLTSFPVGHPCRPAPCTGLPNGMPNGMPLGVRAPAGAQVTCLQFVMPAGEGDGAQVELLQSHSVVLSRRQGILCAIQSLSRVVSCWGDEEGKDSDPSNRAIVNEMPANLTQARAVAVVQDFACALHDFGGAVSCWGSSNSTPPRSIQGIVGETHVSHPLAIHPPTGMMPSRWIGGAENTVCSIALATDELTCWGRSENWTSSPPGLTRVRSVSVNLEAMCAVDWGGRVQCWGPGAGGYGAGLQLDAPASVVAVGFYTICALLSSSGRVVCTSSETCTVATAAAGCTLSPDVIGATLSVDSQWDRFCALDRATRLPVCWFGPQLEAGFALSIEAPSNGPRLRIALADKIWQTGVDDEGGQIRVWGDGGAVPDVTYPAGLPPTSEIVRVSYYNAGLTMACATVLSTGQAGCWDTFTLLSRRPPPGLVEPYSRIYPGLTYSLYMAFALSPRGIFAQVLGPPPDWNGSVFGYGAAAPTFSEMAALKNSICGILYVDRRVVCFSELPELADVPPSLPPAASIALSDYHACAIAAGTGKVQCWGDKAKAWWAMAVPTDLPPSAKLGVGRNVTCSLAAITGEVSCWGHEDWVKATPVGVAKDFACSIQYCCMSLNDTESTIQCWGLAVLGPPPRAIRTSNVSDLGPVVAMIGFAGSQPVCMFGPQSNASCYSGSKTTSPMSAAVQSPSSREIGVLDPRPWLVRMCVPHHHATGSVRHPICDTAPVSVRYGKGRLLAARVGPSNTSDVYYTTLLLTVASLGEPPRQATGQTAFLVRVCNWRPGADPGPNQDGLGCNSPGAASSVCERPSRVGADTLTCLLPTHRLFGGSLSLQLTAAGYDLGVVPLSAAFEPLVSGVEVRGVQAVDAPLEAIGLPVSTPAGVSVGGEVQGGDAGGYVRYQAASAGDTIIVSGARFWDANATAAAAPTALLGSGIQPSCVYLPAAGSINKHNVTACTCNSGAEDFPGEGEVPPSFIQSWNDTTVRLTIPPGIGGIRTLALCAWGALAVHPTLRLALSLPRVLSANVEGSSAGRKLSLTVRSGSLQTLAPPGPSREYLSTLFHPSDNGWYRQPVPHSRGGWPTARMVIQVGPKCYASVESTQFVRGAVRGPWVPSTTCEDWGGWRASYDPNNPSLGTFTTDWIIPSGLMSAQVSVTVTDIFGHSLFLHEASGQGDATPLSPATLPVPILVPSLRQLECSGLTDSAAVLEIRGQNIPSLPDAMQAAAEGWLLPGIVNHTDPSMELLTVTLRALPGTLYPTAALLNSSTLAIPCWNATSRADTSGGNFLSCTPPFDTRVGHYALTVMLAGSLLDTTSLQAVTLGCAKGYYGGIGEQCTSCASLPTSGVVATQCPGGMAYPAALPGWHVVNESAGMAWDACPASRKVGVHGTRRRSSTPLCVVPCEPPDACIGENRCGHAYMDGPPGWRCSECSPGYYRAGDGGCVGCPSRSLILIVGTLLSLVLAAGGLYALNKAGIELTSLGLLVEFVQVVSMAHPSTIGGSDPRRLSLPATLLPVMDAASALTLNFNLLAAECFLPGLPPPFVLRFWVVTLSPLLLAACVALTVVWQTWSAWRKHQQMKDSLSLAVAQAEEQGAVGAFSTKDALLGLAGGSIGSALRMSLRALQFLYFIIVATVMSVLNCTPSSPPEEGGALYLAAVPYEQCGTSDPRALQNRLLGWAYVSFVVYVLGIPSAVAYVYYAGHAMIVSDQRMKAEGNTASARHEPVRYSMRKLLGPLYGAFKPGYHHFFLLALVRKALLCALWLVFNKAPSLQLVAAAMVVVAGQLLTAWFRPLAPPRAPWGEREEEGEGLRVRMCGMRARTVLALADRNNLSMGLATAAATLLSFSALWQGMAPGSLAAAYYPGAGPSIVVFMLLVIILALGYGVAAFSLDCWLQLRVDALERPAPSPSPSPAARTHSSSAGSLQGVTNPLRSGQGCTGKSVAVDCHDTSHVHGSDTGTCPSSHDSVSPLALQQQGRAGGWHGHASRSERVGWVRGTRHEEGADTLKLPSV